MLLPDEFDVALRDLPDERLVRGAEVERVELPPHSAVWRHIACAPSSAAISSNCADMTSSGTSWASARARCAIARSSAGVFDFSDMAAGKTPPQLGFQRNGRAENRHLRVIPALLKVAKLRSRRGRIRGGCPLGTPTAAYDGCASSCRGTGQQHQSPSGGGSGQHGRTQQ